MKYFLLLISLAYFFLDCQSQIIITDKIAENFLKNEYHALYNTFIDSIKTKRNLYLDFGYNQLKYDSSKKELVGISNEEKNNERVTKEYILTEDNIEFSFKLNKSSTVSDNLEDLIGVNISITDKKETIHFAIFQTLKFARIFTVKQKKYLADIINHTKLYDTKLYNKYTKIDSKSYTEYGQFTIFTINIRLRNAAINGRVNLYDRPTYYYNSNTSKYQINKDSIVHIWEAKKNEYSQNIDTTGKSAIVVTTSEDKKYYSISPVIAIKNVDFQHQDIIYFGYVLYEDFKSDLSLEEKELIWSIYDKLKK